MRQAYGTFVLVIVTMFFLFTAWSSGTAPAMFAQRLGLTIANAGGNNEIRAQYAGFFLAAAVFCAASLAGVVSRLSGFSVPVVIFGGLNRGASCQPRSQPRHRGLHPNDSRSLRHRCTWVHTCDHSNGS